MKEALEYKEIKVSKVVEFLIFISVFISSYTFFKQPFEGYLHYLVFILLIPFFALKYGYPKYIAQILIGFAIVGIFNVFLDLYPPFDFIKIWGGLLLSLTFYYYVLCYYKFNLQQIFKVYLTWAYYICLIGYFQLASFIVGFGFGYNYTWIFNKWGVVDGGLLGLRVNSVFSEPATLGTTLGPAAYVALYNLLHKKNFLISKVQSMVILSIFILASSSTAYIGLLLILFLVSDSLKVRYFFVGAIGVVLLVFSLYSYSVDFKYRIDSSRALWIDNDFSIENTNSSSFVLYNNYRVTSDALAVSPFFGTGLGSYSQAFENYTITKTVLNYDFEFNTADGNSLFFRMMVETGLVGTGLFIFLLIRGFIPKRKSESHIIHHRIIGQAIFIMIMLYLLRQGNYFLNAFPFFVLMYYYNWKQYKESQRNSLIEAPISDEKEVEN